MNSFVTSPRILTIIDMSKRYGQRPSSIVCSQDDPLDEYTAFCFDEACTFILSKIEQDETPEFQDNSPPTERHFSSYSEMLKYYDIQRR